MSLLRSVALVSLALCAFGVAARAEVELIAGFNFGQFLQPGEPALDGVSFERAGSIPGNWTAGTSPGPEDTGEYKVQNNLSTVFQAGDAMLWFDGSHGSSAWTGASVNVVERGGLDSTNAQMVGGEPMYAGDDRNLHLQLNAAGGADLFSITLSTLGYSDFDPAAFSQTNDFNFTFAAYNASGASASIEWFLGDRSLGIATATSGNGNFQAFNIDLASDFFGQANATLVGKVTGDIVIDHLQINGVKAAPVTFTQQPGSLTLVSGAEAVFTVAVSGATNPGYRWRFNDADLVDGPGVSGASTATLRLNPITPARAGSYTVVVNNNGVTAESGSAVLVVHVAPTFVLRPNSATANPGEAVVFEAEAAGFPAPAYQWFKDGEPLVEGGRVVGVASASLRLTGLTAADEGGYTVRISNAAGSLESNAAVLTITDDAVAPSIHQHPSATSVVLGQEAVFRVVASGAPAPAYQWFKGEELLSDGGAISGATTATLRVVPASLAAGGLYRVVVGNSAGTIESGAALLTVHTLPRIPAGQEPQGGWVTVGGSHTFSVSAEGVPAPSYQWFKDGEPIEGETGPTLTVEPVDAADAGSYTVVITNAAGSLESAPAVLQVSTPARIVVEPQGLAVGAGAQVTLRVTASGFPAPAYQWFKNGDPIPEATDAVLNLGKVQLAAAGDYTVVVANVGGEDTSVVARVDVAASIRRGGAARTFAPGTQVSLDSGFAADAAYRFVWLRNGAVVPGAGGSTFLIRNGRGVDSGDYTVRVYSAAGRLLVTVAVARVSFNVSGNYDALLRSTADQSPDGVVRLLVAANGTFTGTLAYADGRAYPINGRFVFGASPSEGTAQATVKRAPGLGALRLTLSLDAREASVEAGVFVGDAAEPSSAGEGERRASATVPWRGRYSLSLEPLAPPPGQPAATATLRTTIQPGAVMTLAGRLADGTPVTATVPGSTERGYAVFLRPYAKGGYVGGLLRLVEKDGAYEANSATGGDFVWFRSPGGSHAGVDVDLKTLLATP